LRVQDMNWMDMERYLEKEDRCVVPVGCTEQHSYLSLATDSILAERVSVEAADPLGVVVFPVLPYGVTPTLKAYPGSVSLRVETMGRVVEDALDGLYEQGFRRILIVNGHGGNQPVAQIAAEWTYDHADASARFHNWWNAPRTWATVQSVDPVASHGSWMENFPWTRLPNVAVPEEQKDPVNPSAMHGVSPEEVRRVLGDGNFAGRYRRPDEDMRRIWEEGVLETRSLLENWTIR